MKVVNAFNEYYVSVGADLANAVPPVVVDMVDDRDHQVDSTFQIEPVCEGNIDKVVNDLKWGFITGCGRYSNRYHERFSSKKAPFAYCKFYYDERHISKSF